MSCVNLATQTSTSTLERRRGPREWSFTRDVRGYKSNGGTQWHQLRRSILRRRSRRCAICGTDRNLDLHHSREYTPNHVVFLCESCHKTLHGAASFVMGGNYYGSRKLWFRTRGHCRSLRRAFADIARRAAENYK
jgi:hypothetical protein